RLISDIAKKRISNAIREIVKEENGKMNLEGKNQDLGFKSFRLSFSNFKKWQSDIRTEKDLMNQLAIFKEPLQTEPSDTSILLFELLAKAGLQLSAKVEKKQSRDKLPYFVVEGGQVVFA